MIPITEEHSYVNKIKNSNSIFRFEDISRKTATELGLWDYPDNYGYDMSPILGLMLIVQPMNDSECLMHIMVHYMK